MILFLDCSYETFMISPVHIFSSNLQMMKFWEQCGEIIYGLTQALKGVPLVNHSSVRKGLRRKRSNVEDEQLELTKKYVQYMYKYPCIYTYVCTYTYVSMYVCVRMYV